MLNLRQIISSASLYTFLGLLPALSRIILLPIFLLFLSVEEFGLISLNTLLTSILPVFFTMSLEHSVIRFYFDYRTNPKLIKTYLSTVLLSVLTLSTILCLFILPFGDLLFSATFKTERFSFQDFGWFVLLQSAFMSLIAVMNAYFRTAQKLKVFALFSISQLVVSTVAETLAIVHFNADALLVVTVKTWATGIVTGIFLLYLFSQIGIRFDRRFLPSSVNYALPIIPYILFGLIFSSVDRIIIENYLTLTALAVFNLAISIANLTELYIVAIQNATYPIIYDLFKKGYKANTTAINAIYKFKGSLILVGIGVLTLFAYPLIHFFLVPEYQPAIGLIPILLSGYMMRFYYIVYSEPVFFFKQTRRLPALNFLLGIVSVSFNLLLIPFIGLLGAAITSVLARAAQLVPTLSLYKNISDFRFSLGSYHVFALLSMLALLTTGFLQIYIELSQSTRITLFSIPFLISIFAVFHINKNKASV